MSTFPKWLSADDLVVAKTRPYDLQNEEGVFRMADQSLRLSVIYFLCYQGKVVYVGQSIDVLSRLTAHRRDKTFDDVYFVLCDKNALDEAERQWIQKLNPPLNFFCTERAKAAARNRPRKMATRRRSEANA